MPQVIPGNAPLNTSNPPSTPPNPWAPPASDNFGWGNSNPSASAPSRLTPQERVEMIEKLYQEVLGRKPDTRDINYYKYSTLSEEEIRKQLITGKEHKQLMDDGRDYKKMKERALASETRVAMLESQIKDQVEEFRHLSDLLTEKNQYIQQLRTQLNNPYNLTQTPATTEVKSTEVLQPAPTVVPQATANEVYTQPATTPSSTPSKKNKILEIIKNLLPD